MALADDFNAQDLSGQLDQIRNWVAQNPTATQQQIDSAMQTYGISPQKVALALGNQMLQNAPPAVQAAQQQFAQAEQAFQGVTGRVGTATRDPMAGQVADWQVQQYLRDNPNLTDAQVLDAMVQYGVTPAQMARATGVDINTITPRIAAVEQARATAADTAQRQANPPPTGLIGFEQAAQQGVQQATGTLQGAQAQARGDLTAGMEEVARLYGLNIDELRAAEQQARGDLGQAMGVQRGLFGENIAGIGAAGERARGDLERLYGQAGTFFTPYQQAGTSALQQQLALSGALGTDALRQAYQESPYVQFLREQGERSTLAGAAATGGLGGGRVQQELVRFGQGLAGQGLQQQIENLRNLSGMGFQAAGSGAELATGLGTNLANLGTSTAQNLAAQRAALAGVEGQYGTNLANLATGTAQGVVGQRGALAGERSQFGTNLANLATTTGTNIANLQSQLGGNIAQQRMRAGELLAGQAATTAAGLGDLALSQGADIANLINQYGTAGLNLSQGYTADEIAAYQRAAEQEAAAQQGYGQNIAGLLSGQPFTQQQPFDYSGAIGGALNAAALGYDLTRGQTSNPTYVGPMSRNWPSFSGQVRNVAPQTPYTGLGFMYTPIYQARTLAGG